MIDMVVDGDDVYIVSVRSRAGSLFLLFFLPRQAENGEMILLDASSATPASLKNTWFIGLLRWLGQTFRRHEKSKENEMAGNTSPEDSGSETGGYDSSSSKKARRMAAGRAGGMRRKAVKNRKTVKAVS